MKTRALVVLALAGLFVVVSDEPVSGKRAQCGSIRPCEISGGIDCHKAPTSLWPVTPDPSYEMFEVPEYEGNCGFEECYVLFYCACGDPLAGAACSGPIE